MSGGRHRAEKADATSAARPAVRAAATKRKTDSTIGRTGPSSSTWRGTDGRLKDGWFLLGFFSGIIVGGLGLWAGFLLWLSGG